MTEEEEKRRREWDMTVIQLLEEHLPKGSAILAFTVVEGLPSICCRNVRPDRAHNLLRSMAEQIEKKETKLEYMPPIE